MFVCATLNSEYEPHLDRGAALDCDGQTPECAQTPGLQFCLFVTHILGLLNFGENFQTMLVAGPEERAERQSANASRGAAASPGAVQLCRRGDQMH